MTDTILVTGATGKVGRRLVTQLLAAGHHVRALTRDPSAARLPAGAEVVAGDLADTASLTGVFDGVRAVHLITFGGWEPLTNGKQLLDLALAGGVRRATVLQGDVTASPLEEVLMASELEWTRLAPVEFMDNMLDWAEPVRTEGVVREGFAGTPSSCVHPADIAAVAAVALTTEGHAGRQLWLTGPEALTPRDKTRIIGEVLSRDLTFVELSRDEVIKRWRAQGYDDETVQWFLAMSEHPPVEGRTVSSTVRDVTGVPARTFRQWVTEYAGEFGGAVQ